MPTGIEDMLVRLVGRLQIRSRRCVGLFVADAEDTREKKQKGSRPGCRRAPARAQAKRSKTVFVR
jgi:hypothetical protein